MKHKTAMILAAGRGERMRPLTDSMPKPLLPLAGKPLIEYHIRALAEAGYQTVVINHAWLGYMIEAALGKGDQFGLQILYSPESSALETAGGIVNAMPLLTQQGETSFTVVNGDVFSDFDYAKLPARLEPGSLHVVMVDNPEHNPSGDFYLQSGAMLDETRAGNIPKLTFAGIAHYHKDVFMGLDNAKRPLAPLLRKKIQSGQASGFHHRGIWHDIGTPQRLAEVEKRLLANRSR